MRLLLLNLCFVFTDVDISGERTESSAFPILSGSHKCWNFDWYKLSMARLRLALFLCVKLRITLTYNDFDCSWISESILLNARQHYNTRQKGQLHLAICEITKYEMHEIGTSGIWLHFIWFSKSILYFLLIVSLSLPSLPNVYCGCSLS